MKSDHLNSYFKSPKAYKGSIERHQASQPPNEPWDILERRINTKPLPSVRNVQLDPEILSENIFVSSPNLRLHKSSPRFFIAHQKSPGKSPVTTRNVNDQNLQKFTSNTVKNESSIQSVFFDKVNTNNNEKPTQTQKENQGHLQAPKSSLALTKKTSRGNPAEGPREVVIQLTDHNQSMCNSLLEQPGQAKRVSEEKRGQKPAIKICTDILMKGLSPRNVRDSSCKSNTRSNEAVISCRNLTAQTTANIDSKDEKKHLKRNQIFLARQSTEDLHSHARGGKSPIRMTTQMKDVKQEVKWMQALRTPENTKQSKRVDQNRRGKEAKSFIEENRKNVTSKKTYKSKPESMSSSKKSGYTTVMSSTKKSDWNTIAIKKIELNLDSRDSFSSKVRNLRCGELFEDIGVFTKVLDFLSMTCLCQITKVSKRLRSTAHLSLVKKAQCKLIINGLDYEEQYSFWDFHLNFSFLQKAYPLQYMMNVMKPSTFEKDIMSDIDRTRNLPLSQQNTLLKILLAFSNTLPTIGYLQGLNSIGAVFLSQNLTEPEVYWLMKFIFQKKRFGEVFTNNFAMVHLLTYQLEIYVRNYLPKIVDHLGESEINISYFATQWILTMFSYDLELSQLVKIWNLFFIKGWKVVIRMALSILWFFQDDICSKPTDELPSFLKTFIIERISTIPEEELFGAALSFKVSNRLLKYLETLYEHSAPINVILVSGNANKLQWKILPDDCTPRTLASAVPKDLMEYLNENIDHMRSINKMKGDVSNQLDNYRNIPFDRANTSITLDSISIDYRSPMKVNTTHHQAIKSSDLSFIQTLSSLGRKLKQILTPKSGSQSYPNYKASDQEMPDFINDKDITETYTPLTEQSDYRSSHSINRKNCRQHHLSIGNPSFKKSIVSMLRDSNAQLGINLFDPEVFHRDVNRRNGNRSLLEIDPSGKKLNQTERRKHCMEKISKNHKRNSSVNHESMISLREFKSLCFHDMLNERSEKDSGSQPTQHGYTTTLSSCLTEPNEGEMDKSCDSVSKKKAASKNFYLTGKYNKGKSFDKVKIITSQHGKSGMTWNDYQKAYAINSEYVQQERGMTLSISKEGKSKGINRQYEIRF